jgi:TolB-like protein
MASTRRLAAIMFTDIQGYTRLMQQSESRAVAVRARHREVFGSCTEEYEGEIIQYYGDGTLSIFDSTVNAVRCAAAMQLAFQEDPAIPVRVGIHTGDILLTEDDIIGDSVNLAARVESLAVPGSVLVSGKVADEIRSHEDLPLKKMGAFHFKNDTHKRQVFALDLPGLVVPRPKKLKGKLEKKSSGKSARIVFPLIAAVAILATVFGNWFIGSKQSGEPYAIQKLAVLPFSDRMNDPGQAHILNGIHEAIIFELQKAGIPVVPQPTILSYENPMRQVNDLVDELGINGIITGSLMRQGDSIQLDISLIDIQGEQQNYRWNRSYEEEIKDLLFLYKEVTRSVANEIQIALSPGVQQRLNEAEKVNAEAYELYLKGRYELNLGNAENLNQAITYYGQSLEIDPSFEDAYTDMVETYLLLGFGGLAPFEAHTNFRLWREKAIEANPALKQDHQLQAMVKIFSEWDWKGAEEELMLAMEEYPNSSELYDTYCQFLWAMGRIDESVAAGEKAVALDSNNHWAGCNLSWAYYYDGDYHSAFQQLEVTAEKHGWDCHYHYGVKWRLILDTSSLATREDLDLRELERRIPLDGETDEWFGGISLLASVYSQTGRESDARRVLDRMRMVEQERFMDPMSFVFPLVHLGEYDRALDRLEEAYLQRSFFLIYSIKAAPSLDPLRENPRFIAILEKLGLQDSEKGFGAIAG